MAYGNIKGIIVEIGGDTSGLQKALKGVYSQTSSLQKELKGINSLLKLDPKNTELLAQKQKVLKETITETKNRLSELKVAQQQYIDQGRDLNTPQYRALQREIIQTTIELRKLGTEASVFTRIGNDLQNLSSKMTSFGNNIQSIGSKIESLGKTASIASTAVTALITAGIKYNADIEQTTVALETLLGSADEASRVLKNIQQQSKVSPFDTKQLLNANRYLIAADISADEAMETINNLSNAVAMAGGGNYELDRMAINLAEISNNGKAAEKDLRQFSAIGIPLMKILSEMTGMSTEKLKKNGVTYEQLAEALKYASSEGQRYYQGQEKMSNTLTGSINKLKKTFQEFLGELTEGLMPILKKATSRLQELTDSFKELTPEQKEMILKIGLIVAALGPLLIIVGKITVALGAIFKVGGTIVGLISKLSLGLGGLSGILTALSGPIGIIIAVIAALAAAFIALWNNSESFRNSMTEIGSSIVSTFEEHIKPTIDNIISIVSQLFNDYLIPFVGWLAQTLQPVFETVFTVIGNVVATAFEGIAIAVQTVTGIFDGLLKFITGVFTGDWQKAWEGVSQIFGSIFDGLKGLVVTPLNWIIDKINDFIWHVNQIKIPEGVPRCWWNRF